MFSPEVLESYMIATEATNPTNKKKVNFFGKEWDVKINYRGLDFAKNQTGGFGDLAARTWFNLESKLPQISKQIEKKFCEICNKENTEGNIKKYEDIKGLTFTNVYITFYNRKISIYLCGEYDIDPEHGWSLCFPNGGSWDGQIGQFNDAL